MNRSCGTLALLILITGSLSCGRVRSGDDSATLDGVGGEAGSFGSHDIANQTQVPAVTCTDAAPELVGVPADRTLGCVATDGQPLVVACALPDYVDPSGVYVSSCVRHVATGAEYWVTAPWERVLAVGWEKCSGDSETPPPPCFARDCPANDVGQTGFPESLCTETETRQLFDCGGSSSRWDANCCRRTYCTTAADCVGGEVCRPVADPWTFLYSWPELGDDGQIFCDAGGADGSPPIKMCAPPID
jgi:hypothetical protein